MPGRLLSDGKPLLIGSKSGDQVILQPDATLNATARTFYLEWSVGARSGEVVIESARPEFRGKWAREALAVFREEDSTQRITLSGVYLAIRIRLSAPVVGGTVAVYGVVS